MKKPGLALFDFDGTISHKDSFAEFLKFSVSFSRIAISTLQLSPILFQYVIGLMKNEIAKEKVFRHFYGGMNERDFLLLAENFQKNILSGIIKKSALVRMEWHRSQQHELCVVSASFEPLLNHWCKEQSMNLICTKIEMKNGIVTGKFASPNCHGAEKANRIKATYDIKQYETIYAYGDTKKGDGAMFELADKSFFKSL